MNTIDFFIGLFLMNAMPHLVIGLWGRRALSGFGTSATANLVYSAVCLAVSASLFVYAYGLLGLQTQGMYAGALFILLSWVATGRIVRRVFDPDS